MKTPTVRPIEIHGYALISDDNMIAAADGLTPPTLRNEKDWEYYQTRWRDRTSSSSVAAAMKRSLTLEGIAVS